MRKKTHEEYVAELAVNNPSVEVIGQYIDSKTKIEHHCLLHDIYWDIAPTNALRGSGCSKCWKERKEESLQKTHEQYVNELYNVNPYIIVKEQYIDSHTAILHECLTHNIKWKISPANALSGKGCEKCTSDKIKSKLSKTHNQYLDELKKVNPDIIPIEEYKNIHTPILHKCKIDKHEWYARPSNILKGRGCPKCSQRLRRTHDGYVNEVFEINPNIEVIGVYINVHTPILHKCKIDGYEWMAAPHNILVGKGCPQCNESKGERYIRQWLYDNNIPCITQKIFNDCKDTKPLPFDFYLPDYNLCIEFDGEQHYRPIEYFGGQKQFEYIQKHDKIKTKYCENNNIKLLRIPYFKNIEEELSNFLFI